MAVASVTPVLMRVMVAAELRAVLLTTLIAKRRSLPASVTVHPVGVGGKSEYVSALPVAIVVAKEVPPLITRLSLSVSKAAWADVIVAHRHAAPRIPQSEALALVERSPCTIQSSMKRLETVYCESARRQVRGASDLPGNRK